MSLSYVKLEAQGTLNKPSSLEETVYGPIVFGERTKAERIALSEANRTLVSVLDFRYKSWCKRHHEEYGMSSLTSETELS
jgi:hypothetical protein